MCFCSVRQSDICTPRYLWYPPAAVQDRMSIDSFGWILWCKLPHKFLCNWKFVEREYRVKRSVIRSV
jgi:hypothetical protein